MLLKLVPVKMNREMFLHIVLRRNVFTIGCAAFKDQVYFILHFACTLSASSLVAHTARAYSGFCRMKRLGTFLLPPGRDASSSQDYPRTPSIISSVHTASTPPVHTWVERGTMRVKYLAQEHNTMTPAKARTLTFRSGLQRAND